MLSAPERENSHPNTTDNEFNVETIKFHLILVIHPVGLGIIVSLRRFHSRTSDLGGENRDNLKISEDIPTR